MEGLGNLREVRLVGLFRRGLSVALSRHFEQVGTGLLVLSGCVIFILTLIA